MTGQELNPAQPGAQTVEQQTPSLLDTILDEGLSIDKQDEEQIKYGKDLIDRFVKWAMQGQLVTSKGLRRQIEGHIAKIDDLVSGQLNEVMHHEEFQKLEAAWRGLHHLVMETETSTTLKIKVMNIKKDDLRRDLEDATEFDQSDLFKKVYEAEFGTFGGAPFGTLIGDYEFSQHPQDVSLLAKISQVAAAAHAPFIAAASPKLFGWKNFTQMEGVRDLAKIFDTEEYAQWQSFRNSEDSRFVGLCLPHFLLRLPYGDETIQTESFRFEEKVEDKNAKKYLWGNAAYAFAAKLTEAFAMHGWCVAIRGVESGGLVEGLPAHTFKTDEGQVALKCPTELAITDRRWAELTELGYIPLVHCKGTDFAAFFTAQSANKPKQYYSDFATANARLSSQLPYLFATSRIAHYLKAIMRDKIGGLDLSTRERVSSYLNEWITNYVTPDDTANADFKAKKPLRDARIDVEEIPGKPGYYKAIAFLRPHFQLEGLDISLRLVADLPQPGKKG